MDQISLTVDIDTHILSMSSIPPVTRIDKLNTKLSFDLGEDYVGYLIRVNFEIPIKKENGVIFYFCDYMSEGDTEGVLEYTIPKELIYYAFQKLPIRLVMIAPDGTSFATINTLDIPIVNTSVMQIDDPDWLNAVGYEQAFKLATINNDTGRITFVPLVGPSVYVDIATYINSLLQYKVDKITGKGLSTNDYTTPEKDKLNSIEQGAEINIIEIIKKNGVQINPEDRAVNIIVPTELSEMNEDEDHLLVTSDEKTIWNGKADLENGKVPSSQLPSYVDDVIDSYIVTGSTTFGNDWLSLTLGGSSLTPESGKIYIVISSGPYQYRTYRWSGLVYAEISVSLALGETSDTAYRGDRGKIAYEHSLLTGNPHGTYYDQLNGKPFITDRADGIPVWISSTTYNSGAICRIGGVLYASVISNNLNHDPTTSGTGYWMPYTPGTNVSTPQDTYVTTIGDGTNTDIIVTHNLNSRDVSSIVYTQFGDYPNVVPYMERINVNQIRFRFIDPPESNSLRIVIFKPGVSVSGIRVQGGGIEYGLVDITRDKLGLGTASTYNAGTSAGQLLVLDENAHVPNSAISSFSLSEYKGTSTTRANLVTKTTAEKSDWVYVTSDPNASYRGSWMLNGLDPTVLSDWVQISGPMAVGVEFAGYTMCVDSSGNVIPVKKNYKATITGDGTTTEFTFDTGITDPMRPNLTDQNGFEYMTECVRVGATSWKVVFDTAPFSGQVYTVRVTG